MNVKDLKTGDIIRLNKTPFIGIVEHKIGNETIIWLFSHSKAKIIRRTIGNDATITIENKKETISTFKRMLLTAYFENGVSSKIKNEEINFK